MSIGPLYNVGYADGLKAGLARNAKRAMRLEVFKESVRSSIVEFKSLGRGAEVCDMGDVVCGCEEALAELDSEKTPTTEET